MKVSVYALLVFLFILSSTHLLSESFVDSFDELINIQKVQYTTNKNATFCKRPLEMVDTLVFHHSMTPTNFSPRQINDLHLSRGSEEDPWYMIGYSFILNTPYLSEREFPQQLYEGRPLEIVGAHAGSQAFVEMTPLQRNLWEQGEVTCGSENTDFTVQDHLIRNGRIKANVTTLGVVVVGNYSPFSRTNPGGYSPKSPRFLTDKGKDALARLSCQLQKKFPQVKYLKWHGVYQNTLCPGNIKNVVSEIKDLARKYGCLFE